MHDVVTVTQPTVDEPIVFPTMYEDPSTGTSDTADVLRKTKFVLKSESAGLVQDKLLSVSPAVTCEELTLLGERLSTVIVAEEESEPDCKFVDVNAVTVPVTA